MSITTRAINELSTILNANHTINHEKVTDYSVDFIPEAYPAICIEANNTNGVLANALRFEYDHNTRIVVYFIEEAPEDRDKLPHIQKIDSIMETLEAHPQLNGVLNQGINISTKFMERQVTDNIEYVTAIQIEGRKY